MMKTQVLVPTAGVGFRFKSNQPKPLVEIKGRPIFIYCLETFEKSALVDSVILITHQDYLKEYEAIIRQYGLKKVKKVIAGGLRRCDSVAQGLKALDADTEMVVVHDGVRPLVTKQLIEDSINLCVKENAVVVAVEVKPTIKRVDPSTMTVRDTLNRQELWEIQTPQVFKKDLLLKAYAKVNEMEATDDASLVERLGVKVKVLKGDYKNLKVTTPEDLLIAEALMGK